MKKGKIFRSVLRKVIGRNSDVRFLIRLHPGTQLGSWAAGVDGLEEFENVEFVSSSESITDTIKNSDIWVTFESNTNLEAWAQEKTTIGLNPFGPEFENRHDLYKGHPNVTNSDELCCLIDEYKRKGYCLEFKKLKRKRLDLVERNCGAIDGLNHVRIGIDMLAALRGLTYVKVCIDSTLIKQLRNLLLKRTFVSIAKLFLDRANRIDKQQFSFNKNELGILRDNYMLLQLVFYKKNWRALEQVVGVKWHSKEVFLQSISDLS